METINDILNRIVSTNCNFLDDLDIQTVDLICKDYITILHSNDIFGFKLIGKNKTIELSRIEILTYIIKTL